MSLSAQWQPLSFNPLISFTNQDEYLSLAVDLIEHGQYREAIKYLKNNKSLSSKTFESYFLIGYAYKLDGNYRKAIEYLSKASYDKSTSLTAQFELGNCFLKQQLYAPAVSHYSKAIAIDSMFIPAYNNRAYARIRNFGTREFPEDQLQAAKRDLYKVLSMQSEAKPGELGKYFFNIGMIELYLNHYGAAADNLKKATDFSPEEGKYFYYLGISYFLAKAYDDAGQAFRMADYLGYVQSNTEEFLYVIDLVKKYWETQLND